MEVLVLGHHENSQKSFVFISIIVVNVEDGLRGRNVSALYGDFENGMACVLLLLPTPA